MKNRGTVLLTGATGYVGGRLLKNLENGDYSVRCLVRKPEYFAKKSSPDTEIVKGDVLSYRSLSSALQGIHTAVYLIHSMGNPGSFEALDKKAASNFARAAKEQKVRKIIYLGGLSSNPRSSPHMMSRMEVGEILRESGVPTIEFRASIIIGSGSLSFELVRSLTDRLPVMIMPRWVEVNSQPLGIDDLLKYLMAGMEIQLDSSRIVEIGGSELLTYRGLIAEYARQAGKKRLLIPVPVLSPWLSSLWLGLVTPVFARIGRKLIDSIRHPSVITDGGKALSMFNIRPVSAREAIACALKEDEVKAAESRWSDSLSSAGLGASDDKHQSKSSRFIDRRSIKINCAPHEAFQPVAAIGGMNGWYGYNTLWKIRGFLDLLLGGVGMKRGRPVNRELQQGDPLDFWRVEKIEPPHFLRLRAEMKLPGRAWLEFRLNKLGGDCEIIQFSVFYPSGLAGKVYWYALYPAHVLIFRQMIKSIGNKAIQISMKNKS